MTINDWCEESMSNAAMYGAIDSSIIGNDRLTIEDNAGFVNRYHKWYTTNKFVRHIPYTHAVSIRANVEVYCVGDYRTNAGIYCASNIEDGPTAAAGFAVTIGNGLSTNVGGAQPGFCTNFRSQGATADANFPDTYDSSGFPISSNASGWIRLDVLPIGLAGQWAKCYFSSDNINWTLKRSICIPNTSVVFKDHPFRSFALIVARGYTGYSSPDPDDQAFIDEVRIYTKNLHI
jgi:hypothetical protein